MAGVIDAFVGREKAEGRRDQRAHVIEAARARRAEKRFQLRERQLDRIEVGTVGREESEGRTRLCDRDSDLGLLVDREVVEDDDIARPQRGHQYLLDIGEEHRAINRSIEDGWRAQAVEAKRGDDGVRLPMTAGRVIGQPGATRAAAIAP